MSKDNQTKHDRDVAELWEFLRESERISRANSEKAAQEMAELRQELRQSQQKTAEQQRKTDEQLRKNAKDLKETRKLIGDFTRSTGAVLELECLEALRARDEIGGMPVDRVYPPSKGSKKGMEVDAIAVNGKVAMPVEVKRTLRPEHVHDLLAKDRVDRFRMEFPDVSQGKDIVTVIVFAMRVKELNADKELEDPVKLALDAGMVVLQSISANNLRTVNSLDDVLAHPDKQYPDKKRPGKK